MLGSPKSGALGLSLFSLMVNPRLNRAMTALGRFGVHICVTFWLEVNVNKI